MNGNALEWKILAGVVGLTVWLFYSVSIPLLSSCCYRPVYYLAGTGFASILDLHTTECKVSKMLVYLASLAQENSTLWAIAQAPGRVIRMVPLVTGSSQMIFDF